MAGGKSSVVRTCILPGIRLSAAVKISCLVLCVFEEVRRTFPDPVLSAVVRMNCCLAVGDCFIAVTIWIFWPVCWSVTIWGCQTSGWTLTCFGVVKVETGKGDVGHVPVSSVVVLWAQWRLSDSGAETHLSLSQKERLASRTQNTTQWPKFTHFFLFFLWEWLSKLWRETLISKSWKMTDNHWPKKERLVESSWSSGIHYLQIRFDKHAKDSFTRKGIFLLFPVRECNF